MLVHRLLHGSWWLALVCFVTVSGASVTHGEPTLPHHVIRSWNSSTTGLTTYTNATNSTTAAQAEQLNETMIYGIGVRVGFYLQAFALAIGFLNVVRLDIKSQLAGVILSVTMLVTWWTQYDTNSVSPSELWLGTALACYRTRCCAFAPNIFDAATSEE